MKTKKMALVCSLLICLFICVFNVKISNSVFGAQDNNTASVSQMKKNVKKKQQNQQAIEKNSKENKSWSLENGVLTISGYGILSSENAEWANYKDDIVEVHIGDGITEIAEDAFYRFDNLEHVYISNSVTSIGDYAFRYCTNLNTVAMGNSIESIGEYAFGECENLESIELPNSLKKIMAGAFNDCTSLTEVELPKSLEVLQGAAFLDCTNLREVFIPKSLTDIGGGYFLVPDTFSGCDSLNTITFEEGVEVIPDNVFSNCDGLTEITIPESVKTIGASAFHRCANLSKISIPDSVTMIEDSAFFGCEKLEDINFPESLRKIGQSAFVNCNALVNLKLPEGIERIEGAAFFGCSNLTTVYIPKSLKDIGGGSIINIADTFGNCDNLTTVIFEEGIETIPDKLFKGCTGLTEIVIPESVKTIGALAFKGCTNLSKIYIRDNVATIEDDAFNDCINLTIYCISGSAAHKYAEENQIPYEFIDEHIHDFGDWIVEKEADYNNEGYRYRVCNICGQKEEEIIPKLEINWDEKTDYANVHIHVQDNDTQVGISDVKITFINGTNNYEVTTNENGDAEYILHKGDYNISIKKSGYNERNLEYTIEAGDQQLPVISLSKGSFVQGNLTVTEMTYQEIVDAGIDTSDPDNNHVYKYAIKLEFIEKIKEYADLNAIFIKNEKGEIISKGFQYSIDGGSEIKETDEIELETEDNETVRVSLISERLVLVIYGEAHWLKEMFRAELLVLNTSSTDNMEDCEANIELPEGLSLAEVTGNDNGSNKIIGTLKPGEQRNIVWYLRGDVEGDYNVSVRFTGTLQPFNEIVNSNFTTSEPIHVYAGSALNMVITVPEAAYYDTMYTISIDITNVSDKELYNVSNEITGIDQYVEKKYLIRSKEDTSIDTEIEWLSIERLENGDGKVFADKLNPGDSLHVELSTKILWKSALERFKSNAKNAGNVISIISAAGGGGFASSTINQLIKLISYIEVQYKLIDADVITMDGSTTVIPPEIVVTPDEPSYLIDKVAELIDSKLWDMIIDQDESLKISKKLATAFQMAFEGKLDNVGEDELRTLFNLVSPSPVGTDMVLSVIPFEETQSIIKASVIYRGNEIPGDVVITSRSSNSMAKSSTNQVSRDSVEISGETELVISAKKPGIYTLRLEADGIVQDIPIEFYDSALMNTAEKDDGFIYLPVPQKADSIFIQLLDVVNYSLYTPTGALSKSGDIITTGYKVVDNDTGDSQIIIVRGDVNSDGLINEEDVDEIKNGELDEIETEAAKVTNSEQITNQNAEIIQEYIDNSGNGEIDKPTHEESKPDNEDDVINSGKDPVDGSENVSDEESTTEKPNINHSNSSNSGGSSGGNTISHSVYRSDVEQNNITKGTWNYTIDGHWEFRDINGNRSISKWIMTENPYADVSLGQERYSWFYFDENGYMLTGWFTDPLDGNIYYLNPVSDNTLGRMFTGWQWIKDETGTEKCYFFEVQSNGHKGALYKNTTTPDGYTVNEKGEWTVNNIIQYR